MATVNTGPLDRAIAKVSRVANVTFSLVAPLLEDFEEILVEGNRKKVLASKQGDGVTPMPPVTYRGQRIAFPRVNARSFEKFGTTRFSTQGRGPLAAGLHGNLTPAEYKKLDGPPLAPRGEGSRVITNLETAIGQADGTYYAVKNWREVVSVKGKPFLMAHFKGKGRLPVRDLRGVGPWEREEARKAVRNWVRLVLDGTIRS